MLKKYGAYSLLAGLVIAVIVGLIPSFNTDTMRIVLLVLGFAGGALSISSGRTSDFLVAAIALMLAGTIGEELADLTSIGRTIEHILRNVHLVAAAASLVLAVKIIVSTARDTEN
ncbi:MAG: hypothetical protein ACYSU0_21315 [Planctomycetota bacterium]|jgi:hypothetical protein